MKKRQKRNDTTKPVEVMMGRLVIRRSAPSLTLGPSAADIMQSKTVTALSPGAQDVPDIGMQVLKLVALGGVGAGEDLGGGGATQAAQMGRQAG